MFQIRLIPVMPDELRRDLKDNKSLILRRDEVSGLKGRGVKSADSAPHNGGRPFESQGFARPQGEVSVNDVGK